MNRRTFLKRLAAAGTVAVVAPKALLGKQPAPDAFEEEYAAAMCSPTEGSLIVAGGLLAPISPYYSLPLIEIADRPIRSALPRINADRGGIRSAPIA